ncbi:permease prefix domain 1-containing protein [Micromonospora sp. WMMD980]|uniref:permease prefix domain 1-containing protein n=1 Tax=Micromonospora sp. WMMD980 TaxID=3016088 RepID=UPI002415AAB3|nr:permease prefix domain 1-containing protein [Micromonospora sp. WMMD980]MDG4801620.1 permease prefix domain 1-containing protein [Micromonospora sp. WMMD980]
MSSLTDRYVAATLRTVPAPRRAELSEELRASIADMIDDRTAGGQDHAAAEREVLTEMGRPEALAARYSDRTLQLIGPRYYLIWWRVLRMLLTWIPALAGTATGLVKATVGGEPGGAIGAAISVAIQTAVQIAFWVTLSFAVLERAQAPLGLPDWTVDQLPEETGDRQISQPDCFASIAFLLGTIAVIVGQHFQRWSTDDGSRLPVLDPALWSFWLPALIAVLVATVGLEVAKYRARRWTWPLVAVNALLNLAFAAPVVWLLLTDRLLNPELVDRFAWLRDGGADDVTRIAAVVTLVVAVWDVVDSVVKARRAAR